jgi:hypothetical protein
MFGDISGSAGVGDKRSRSPTRDDIGAVRRRGAPATGGGALVVGRRVIHKLLGGLSVAIAAFVFAPAAASAAFILRGNTGQGLPVALRVSNNLSTVTGFAIDWRATCTSGASLFSASGAGRIAVRPFPNFHRSGSYVFSTVNRSNGQTVRVLVSAQLHGKLTRNRRASGRWAAQARVLDASGNQIDSCRTGVVRWKAVL